MGDGYKVKLKEVDKQILSYIKKMRGKYVSRITIAKTLNYSPSYIKQRLTELENIGLIRRYSAMEVTELGKAYNKSQSD